MATFIDELRSNFEIHFRLSKKHSKTQRRSFSHIIQKKTLRRSKFSLFYPISKCGNILVLRFKIFFFVIKRNSLDIRNFFKVIFDTDPAPKGIKKQDQHAIMSQAMIRGMVDEDNDQFVAYFLPVSRILMYF